MKKILLLIILSIIGDMQAKQCAYQCSRQGKARICADYTTRTDSSILAQDDGENRPFKRNCRLSSYRWDIGRSWRDGDRSASLDPIGNIDYWDLTSIDTPPTASTQTISNIYDDTVNGNF